MINITKASKCSKHFEANKQNPSNSFVNQYYKDSDLQKNTKEISAFVSSGYIKVSMFANHYSKEPNSASLDDILCGIKSGRWEEIVTAIRNESDKKKRSDLKLSFPCFTPSCTMEGGRGATYVKEHSGFVLIDIDKQDNAEVDLMAARGAIALLPYVYSIFVTAGGAGLAVICRISERFHAESYEDVSSVLKAKFGIVADAAAKDVPRLRAVSHDPELIIKDLRTVEVFKPFVRAARTKAIEVPACKESLFVQCEDVVKQLVEACINVAESRAEWLDRAFEFAYFGERGRKLFHKVARLGGSYSVKANDDKFTETVARYREHGKARTAASFLHLMRAEHGVTPSESTQKAAQRHESKELNLFTHLYGTTAYTEEHSVTGQHLNSLPTESCYIDKGITGNGATHLFIHDYSRGLRVLLVPYTSIIDSKENEPHVITVRAGVTQKAIYRELQAYEAEPSLPAPTIVSTYDGLNKVLKALHSMRIDVENIPLMIDEAHQLIMSSSFRAKALGAIMSTYKRFKYALFVSATPMPSSILGGGLELLPYVKYSFPDVPATTVNVRQCSDPMEEVLRLIEHRCTKKTTKAKALHLNELEQMRADAKGTTQTATQEQGVEFHVFVNSVAMIAQMYSRLTAQGIKCKVTYSKSRAKELGESLPYSKASDAPVTVNFYTSAAFDGFDLKITPEEWRAGRRPFLIAIGDGRQRHTKLDLSTSLIQVAGRLRLCPEMRAVQRAEATKGVDPFALNFFYTPSKNGSVLGAYRRGLGWLKDLNELLPFEGAPACEYPKINPNYIDQTIQTVNLDLARVEVLKTASSMSYVPQGDMMASLRSVGFKVVDQGSSTKEGEKVKRMPSIKPNEAFNRLFDEYNAGRVHSDEAILLLNQITRRIPNFDEARAVITEQEFRGFTRWNQVKPIMITRASKLSPEQTTYLLVKEFIEVGKRYSAKRLKEIFAKAFEQLGITSTAKATEVERFFEVKKVRIKGTGDNLIQIIKAKAMFTEAPE